MSVTIGDECEWRRWIWVKEMIIGEGGECRWRKWAYGDLYRKWERKLVSEKIYHI